MPDSPRPLPELVLGDALIDRDALARSTPGLVPGLLDDAAARVLVLRGNRAPVASGALVWRAPVAADRAWYEAGGVVLYLGRVGTRAAVAVLGPDVEQDGSGSTAASATSEAVEPVLDPAQITELGGDAGVEWLTLRDTGLDLPADDVAAFTAALALMHWHATHQHCPRCGARTEPREAGWVRRCVVDGSQHFPRTDPSVIMAVVDEGAPDDRSSNERPSANDNRIADHRTADSGSRILLARGSRWRGNHRSVLAGFVEPGESFEQAVARETFEESGVRVADVRYLGSQPWPFPASLMVGCVARATTTRLTPQPGEIEEIAWYSRHDIAQGVAEGTLTLPGRLSIARALIEHWYGGPLPEPAPPTTPNGAS